MNPKRTFHPYLCDSCGREHDPENEYISKNCREADCHGILGWWHTLVEDASRFEEFSEYIRMSNHSFDIPVEDLKKVHVKSVVEDTWLSSIKLNEVLFCHSCNRDIELGDRAVLIFAEYSVNELSSKLEFVTTLCNKHVDDYIDQEVFYGVGSDTIEELSESSYSNFHTVYGKLEESEIKSTMGFGCKMVDVDHIGTHPRKRLYYGPNWDEIREKVIERDDGECVNCGMSRSLHEKKFDTDLHVHHIQPFREVATAEKANRMENLETVCSKCHRTIETR